MKSKPRKVIWKHFHNNSCINIDRGDALVVAPVEGRHEVEAAAAGHAPHLPQRCHDVIRLQRQMLQPWALRAQVFTFWVQIASPRCRPSSAPGAAVLGPVCGISGGVRGRAASLRLCIAAGCVTLRQPRSGTSATGFPYDWMFAAGGAVRETMNGGKLDGPQGRQARTSFCSR